LTYFKKKIVSHLRRAIFQIFGNKTLIKEETAENIEKAFSQIFLEFFSEPKLYDTNEFSQKKFKITVSYYRV
jgi:hypothetical protein